MTKRNKIILICSFSALAILFITLITLLFKGGNEEITYKVIFNSNGGSEVAEQIINKGDLVSKPLDPTKEGYLFVEWQYNGSLFDFSTTISENITLDAKWIEVSGEIDYVTVKFDTVGGTTISNQVIEKGLKVDKPNNPTKDGYNFIGWYVNNEQFDFNVEINENITITAKWEAKVINNTTNQNPGNGGNSSTPGDNNQKPSEPEVKKHTVTFNSNGGSEVANQKVSEGSKAKQPENPTREGYRFAGWTLNGSDYDFNSTVTGNITLVAKWTEIVKNNYTVTFNSNGGSAVAPQTIVEGSKATQPGSPTRTGYNFNGWTLNGNAYDFNSAVTGNITLVANWAQKTYSVIANRVDNISPARVLTVYEDGNVIAVESIQYSDGSGLCSGQNPNVNYYAIEGETSVRLVLSGGTIVNASLTIN